jgi:prepilin-type N-terminal cleavage/methylation domain-containing protein
MKKNQRGFTLVEMMIGIFLLSIALLGMCSLGCGVMTATVKSKTQSIATTVGQDKIETLKNVDYASLSNGNDNVVVKGITFNRTWTITPQAGHAKMTTVVITWNTPKPSTLQFQSYMGEK